MGSWTTARLVASLSAAVVFLGGSGVHAQNLLQNPGFTGGLGSWNTFSSPPSYTVGWDNVQGNAGVGALSFDMPSSAASTEIYLAGQCAPAAPSTLYDVSGSFRYPSSVGTVPRGGIVVQAFSDALCTGGSLGSSGFGLSFGTDPADTWITQGYIKGYSTPATAQAVRVLLRVNTFAAGGVSGWFDDISITPSRFDYFTLAPCRLVDTRGGAPVGGPVMDGQETRTMTAVGNCGIPGSAHALSVNVAVTQPTSGGNIRLFASDQTLPTVSTINYSAGQTRTNNAIVGLGFLSGAFSAFVGQPTGTTVHLIVDVNGYFE
jgi:hypothetical protein